MQFIREKQTCNLEYDMVNAKWLVEKVCEINSYAQNIYAALCNNEFQKHDVIPILKNEIWSCSWRSAGHIVSNIRQDGDYLDWYCSGIGGSEDGSYVPEGSITSEVKRDLSTLGWVVID